MWSRAHAVVVPGEAKDVFAYIADLPRHAEWSPTPLRVEPETAGPVHVGSRFRGVGETRGEAVESTIEVTEVDPPRRLVFVATSPSTVFRHEFTVTPAGEGSRVERRLVLLRARPLLRLIWPIVAAKVIWPSAVAAVDRLGEVLAEA
ncbi:MAG: SRPBCC family protein [Actinomycetota bacterium]